MRKLVVSEFITLDGVIQAPGGADEDRDGGFKHGGWTQPYWHDDIGKHFMTVLPQADALLLGRRTYVGHAAAFEPMAPGDPFGDIMNAPAKYVVSKTLEKPTWRNTTIIRDDDVVGAVRRLKAQPGKMILTDGSTQLVHLLLQADLVDELHLLLIRWRSAAESACSRRASRPASPSRKRCRIRAASSASTTSGGTASLIDRGPLTSLAGVAWAAAQHAHLAQIPGWRG